MHMYVCMYVCLLVSSSMCVREYLHACVCVCGSLFMCQCVDMCLCECVVYVHVLSSPELGVRIIGFLIWSKLRAFSGHSLLIYKITRSDRMSFSPLHAQMLYAPVKPRDGRQEVQTPAALCDFSRSQPFLALV